MMKRLLAALLLMAAPAFGQAPSRPQGFIYVTDAQGHSVSTLSAYSGSSAATRGSVLITKAASGTSTQVFELGATTFTCGSIPSTTPSYKGQGPTTVITISGSTLSALSTFIGKCSNLTVVGSDGTRYIDSTGTAFSTVGNTNGLTIPHPSTTISGSATTPGFFVGPNSSTNNPAFNVTRTIGGDVAVHAYDDFTTYTLTKNTIGAASFAGEVTINLGGFTLGHYNGLEPFTAFTVNGSGPLDSAVGVGITNPLGSGAINHVYGISCVDFEGRGTGTFSNAGNIFLNQEAAADYRYKRQGNLLGRMILGTWTNEAFESSTSKFVVYEPWTLDGSNRGNTWPGIFGVGVGVLTSISGKTGNSDFGSYGIDKGFYIGGGGYTTDNDWVTTAVYGKIGFLKANATSANTAGYITFQSNDAGGATTTVEHARIDSSGLKLPDLTASQVVVTNASKYLTSTASPAMTSPTMTTQSAGDNSTKGATTAYADRHSQAIATTYTQTQSTGTTETTLWDTPAFTRSLTNNGDTFHFRLIGTIAAHASRTRQLKLYFRYNTNQYFAVGDTTGIVVNVTSPVFVVEGTVTRRASASDPAFVRITINGATGAAVADSMGYNSFGADIEGLKLTGTCGAGSSNGDIILESGQVWFTPKEP